MPLSLGFFALTLLAFLLQVPEILGVLLMMFAAPFWSVVLVNAGFVGIAVEATLGLVPRLWLVAPLMWFGGYAVAVQMSQQALRQEIATYNNTIRPAPLAFNPALHSLVVEDDPNLPQDLLHDHALSTVHVLRRDSKTKAETWQVYRIGARETCNALHNERSSLADLDIFSIRFAPGDTLGRAENCLFVTPGMPEKPAFRVTFGSKDQSGFLLRKHAQHLDILAPDGRSWHKWQATLESLSGFPRPVIGCYIRNGSRWVCSADFLRDPKIELGDASGFLRRKAVETASALGLGLVPPGQRTSPLPLDILAITRNPAKRNALLSLKQIDNFINAGHGFPHQLDMVGLIEYPHVWRHRVDAFVELFDRTLRAKAGNDSGLLSLDQLLARMPSDDFRRVGPRLLASLANKPDHVCKSFSATEVFKRLHSLGSAALPLFAAILKQEGARICDLALEQLCLLGFDGAPLAEQVQKIYRATSREGTTSRLHFHAYVALLAMGHKDRIVEDKPGNNMAIDRIFQHGRGLVLSGRLKDGCAYGF